MLNQLDRVSQSIQTSYAAWLRDTEAARQELYVQYREYYDGEHESALTDRLAEFLQTDTDTDFTANYCPIVIDTKADRLKVTAFEVEGDQGDVLWKWWKQNRMDRLQGIVHRAAVRDGDAFILVEWDNDKGVPRYSFEPAYAGEGVMVYYSPERRDEIEFASKHWRIKYGEGAATRRRLNLYFNNRVEKYISDDDINAGNWRPFIDDNTEYIEGKLGPCGVVWWTTTGKESGDPLGVPVFHFKNNDQGDPYGQSEIRSVIPIQNAVNKTLIDLLGAADVNGFSLLVGYGTKEWTEAKVGPGAIASVSAKPDQAKLEKIPADDMKGLLDTYNALVMEIARVSRTPLSYFQSTGQVSSAETLKQQEIALIGKVEKSQTDFGNVWEDIMIMSRRLANVFNQAGLDETLIIDSVWRESVLRNEKEQADTLAIKVEKLGVSEEQAQEEMGYDATQRASFRRAQLRKQSLTIRNAPVVPPNEQQTASDTITPDVTQNTLESGGT